MTQVQSKPQSMKMAQVRQKAKDLGIEPGKMKKVELIHAIQRTEGNTPCFGTTQGWCSQEDCCFRYDCLKCKS